MPASRRRDAPLTRALAALSGALSATGAPWMVIGGIASIARGVRRLTTDIDAVVRGDAISIPALLEGLRRYGIAPRIDDALEFAEQNLVLLVRHEPTGVDLDVSLGWTKFELEALAARSRATFGSVEAPMATPSDLVVFKAMAGRPKDLEDASALLALFPRLDVARVRKRLSQLAEAAGVPELIHGFDDVVARAKPPSRTPRRRRKRR